MRHCAIAPILVKDFSLFFSLLLDDFTPYGIWINLRKSTIVKAQLKRSSVKSRKTSGFLEEPLHGSPEMSFTVRKGQEHRPWFYTFARITPLHELNIGFAFLNL